MNMTRIGQAAPLFELKGFAAGLSYFIGILIVGQDRLLVMATEAPSKIIVLGASFGLFIFSVLFIQGKMGFAVSANTFGKPNHLVTEGLFQYSRNPIYLAFWMPLLSISVVSIPASLVALALYVVSMNLTVLRTEERDLKNLFGQIYLDYAQKVPRWILI
jgi:protein-S-isoprenylcysteine O-methyltransferase Ste14